MAKVLQKLFWVAITFKRYHSTSGCGTKHWHWWSS